MYNSTLSFGCIIVFVSVLLPVFSFSQPTLQLSGSWSCTVQAANVTEAGNDFPSTWTSPPDQVLLSVGGANAKKNRDWTVCVSRSDIDWDPAITVYVVRSSDGTANNPATIAGGAAFQQVTLLSAYFFNGSRNRSNIGIQYQLNGISVLLDARVYSTTIVYTISSP